ncbi:MAG: hypothetical protein OEY34_08290 [Cyclobacteriaceae bacterium]|nr:hypothetical protein [Cyclobacteriaceae bacterium]
MLADFYSKRTLEGYLTEIDNYMFSKYGSDYFLLSSYGNTYTKAPLLQGQYLGLNYRRNMGKNHVEFSTIFGWFYIENLVINRTYKQKNSHEKLIYQLGMDRPFLENGALGVVGNYNWTINEWVGLNVKILVSTVFIRDAVFYESEKSLITKETINKEYNYHTNLVSTSLTLGINFSFSSY